MLEHQAFLHSLARYACKKGEIQPVNELAGRIKDWPAVLKEAELYAVATQLSEWFESQPTELPKEVGLSLKALGMRHRAAADARYQMMSELLSVFSNANLPVVALKGLALAPMLFAKDYLRPMRDIDLLVPSGEQLRAGALLRGMGFDLPDVQPSKFMRDSHQLPNATKKVNGFLISVEIHHNALSRDVPGNLFFSDVEESLQDVTWRELSLTTLGHEHMLHQVCRHLAGLHPGAVLKLINVMDAVMYAENFCEEINWSTIKAEYPHVVNTLRCLDQILPLSQRLAVAIGGVRKVTTDGVGESMQPLTKILAEQGGITEKAKMLLMPPDWWMHLYYNVDPAHSLLFTKLIRHPIAVFTWLARRFKSRLLGG